MFLRAFLHVLLHDTLYVKVQRLACCRWSWLRDLARPAQPDMPATARVTFLQILQILLLCHIFERYAIESSKSSGRMPTAPHGRMCSQGIL